MLIDTHAHVNFKDFKDDQEAVVKRALDNGIWMINVGSELRTSQRAVEMSRKYGEGIFAAIGLHPVHLSAHPYHEKQENQEDVEFSSSSEEFQKEKYRELIRSERVVAIGEIGLDYFHEANNKDLQKKVFEEQIDLAVESSLPIIIHCRNAHEDMIEILRKKKKEYGEKLRGVLHCFSGNSEEARIYTEELGFFLGWTGIITFSREYEEILKNIDLNYFLVETDCPYLTPMPFRGKRNEPLYVEHVARKIAEIRGISFEEVSEKTTENAKILFSLEIDR